jgi:protein-disulfide isomerase
MSRFGTLGGVPVAISGFVWFVLAALLVAGARRGPPAFQANVGSYLFVLSTVGLAVILYLAYASLFVLRTVCLLCLTTYVAVIGTFILSGAVASQPLRTLPRRLLVDLRTLARSPGALALAGLLVIVSVAAVVLFPRQAIVSVAGAAEQETLGPPLTDGERSEFVQWYESQPRVNLPVDAGGAKVLVVKFTDYQCPACAETYLAYKSIEAKYAATHPGEVKFVTLDYQIDPACNPSVQRRLYPASCDAAVAVRLAREHGKGEAMADWLARNRASLSPASVREAARTVGGVMDFEARYASVIEAVKTDGALGGLNNVTATPTFFINGKMIVGGLPPRYFDQAIALELARAG